MKSFALSHVNKNNLDEMNINKRRNLQIVSKLR